MDIVIHSVESVTGISAMIVLGLVLTRLGYFDEKSSDLIAFLLIRVSLPCVALLNIIDNFNYENLHNLFYDMALPALSMVAGYYIGSFFCFLLKVPRGRREIFKAMFYMTNCLFIGLPVTVELFGEAGTVYAFEYYIATTVGFWTVGIYKMAAEGLAGENKFNFLATAKTIIFSPLLGLICGIVLILLGINVPGVLKTPLRYMGSMTTPLSMLFIGIALSNAKPRELITVDLEMLVAYAGRFIAGPLVLFIAHQFIFANELLFKVTVIQSAMPFAAAVPPLAATYGLDVKYSAVLTSVSTVLFIAVVPVYMWIMHIYFGG